jgi:hypothetical protein
LQSRFKSVQNDNTVMMINPTTHKRERHTMISSDKEYLGHVIATYSPFLVRSALTLPIAIFTGSQCHYGWLLTSERMLTAC